MDPLQDFKVDQSICTVYVLGDDHWEDPAERWVVVNWV